MRRGVILIFCALLTFAAVMPSSSLAAGYTGPNRVYFPQTQHYLSLGFLDFWLNNGGLPVFGYPITEELQQNGVTVQYFQRAVFEYHPNAPAGQRVQLRRLGADIMQQAETQWTASHDRYSTVAAQIGLPPSDSPNPFAPAAPTENDSSNTYFQVTQHSVSNGFRDFWGMHGGLTTFGYPISQELFDENTGLTVQYFERAVFEWHPDAPNGNTVQLRLLGTDAAQRDGVNTAPVKASSGVPNYNLNLWKIVKPANPAALTTPLPGAPSGFSKWIEVDLSQQYMRAWQNDKVVYQEYVSTGLPDTPTPTGYFKIYVKLRFDEMKNGKPGDPDYYDLKNVPWVMYFLQGGYALHGTYWHHNFGHEMSHGCVNMTTPGAQWVYQWAPLGTVVWIHN